MGKQWPIETVGLDDLDLDLRNVRIPGGGLDQTAIARYMVEAEDVLDLARDILRDGYLDNELPVIVDEDGRCVVLEGNRRITALKAIRDPSLLGASASKMMERLLSRYPDADKPSQVRVMIAPSREAAQQLLARLHTRNPKKSWLREQQAIFYHAQLSPTMTADDLRAGYPIDASKITKFIRMGEMRNLIRELTFEDRELEEFIRTSKLKMTSFEYAYGKPKIQKALGLEFDKDGLLVSKRISTGQARGLIYLLARFKDGTLDTRSPELISKNPAHESFAEFLRQIVAPSSVPGAPGSGDDDLAGTGQPSSAGQAKPGNTGHGNGPHAADGSGGAAPTGLGTGSGAAHSGSRGPNRGDTRSRLDMSGFEYGGASAGLKRRFDELRQLDVQAFPNAAYDLMRTLMECAIKDYFRTKNQPLASKATLGPSVKALEKDYNGDTKMIRLINAMNRDGSMPASQYAGTAPSFNAANHDPDSFATGRDAHEAWDRIKPILIEIVGK